MKKIKPAPLASIAIALFILVSSIYHLLFQPEEIALVPFWVAGLLVCVLLISASALSLNRGGEDRSRVIWTRGRFSALSADLAYLSAVALLVVYGRIGPDLKFEFLGLSAVFTFGLVLPLLLVVGSFLAIKDSINLLYGYTARGREVLVFSMVRLSAVFTIILLGGIISVILYRGIGAISWEFLTSPHLRLGQQGGIATCIEGTFWLVMGAMLISAPLGIGAAIYLNEYSKNSGLKRIVTIAVGCLNGVPSVVYGLFGLAFLVSTVGISLLAGSIILGLMNLPTIILTSQEALKSVPNSLREGSVALGASRWQTVKKVVIPSALPGVLTGLIIGVARAAGETAPIMWTAVTFSATPVHMFYGFVPDVTQPVNNLCYHLLNLIYFLGAWDVEQNAWGTALVLLALVLSINMVAILVRNHYRKKIAW
ncbi:phosphate ABC transporter permease PstA [Methanotrichaceae archaeon M04Ac]|uniref:Phosphate transport system permease protein PstA n=1 Tax=Candidatus Methanocrinis alkalitolerans TaxID=3033395 RepID=A0ABT5XDU2_9EURY|nr:phosphate ABC transporter permease PstA [Candidatus Methanocrinis alkalitolerans]MCR3883579.1 phosphate ABC transporter permease PstA [Methanothrix sp.]MDF0592883.1 phosphate ABC transporter permease PstA [Candidatus Methanocrinis alkalitolerans]